MRRWLAILFCGLRLGVAAVLVFVSWQDRQAARAAQAFETLPDYDYAAQARTLLEQERYSEALLVIDAGVDAADAGRTAQLESLRGEVETERDRLLRRFQDVGMGALTGRGTSAESLAGAVVADLFVFGDVRDLVIQAGRKLRGEDADAVIVGLSAAGIVLSATPELDLGASLLKFARKMGALSERLAAQVARVARRAVQEREIAPLAAAAGDVAALGRSARPAGALVILRSVESLDELRIAASFAQRPGGAFALWLSGRGGLTWLKTAGAGGQELLLRASRKGAAGLRFVGRNGSLLLQAHPLLGVVKALHKGTLQDLAAELMTPRLRGMLLAVTAGWLLLELFVLAWLLSSRRRR